jgi:hypothetical protein
MKFGWKSTFNTYIIFLAGLVLFSCKPTVVLVDKTKRNIRVNEIIKADMDKKLAVNNIWVKKINGTVLWEGKEENFRASYKVKRDSVIVFSLMNKIGIEALRIICTTDSFGFIDRVNRNYFFGEYDALTRKIGHKTGFDFIQSVLLNEIVTVSQKSNYEIFNENRKLNIEEDCAVVRFSKNTDEKSENREKINALYKFDTRYLNPTYVRMEEDHSENILELVYAKHSNIGKTTMPGIIEIRVKTKELEFKSKLLLERIEINTTFITSYLPNKKYKKIEW